MRSGRSIGGGRFYSGIETLFFGLSLGSVLVLIAIGLAITFGVMGVINMAHGELMMLGAYTTYVVQTGHARTTSRRRSWSPFPRHLSWPALRGRADRAHDHPVSLRPAARDAARDLRREPHAAAVRAIDLFGAQPVGDHAGVDERHAAAERGAVDYLQPPVHRDLHVDRVRDSAGRAEADTDRARYSSGLAEPRHGAGDGHPQRMGGRDDVRPRFGHRRGRRRRAESVDERRPESGAVLHHRFVHGRRVRRRRQSLGRADRRHVDGHRESTARTVCGRRAGKDLRARRADSVHSDGGRADYSRKPGARRRR